MNEEILNRVINKKLGTTVRMVLDEIENKRNHSWYKELYERNKKNLDDVALLYRGEEISYRKMFNNMKKYAKSMKKLGVGKNSELPICMLNSPEFIYTLGGASLVGAKVNIFGSHYPVDYIEEIIDNCKTNVVFIEDNAYSKIKEAIKSKYKIVMNSLRDSLTDNYKKYEKLDRKNGLFVNKVDEYKKENNNILSTNDFIEIGKNYKEKINDVASLDDEFTITYTSGSTNEKRPKAIIHTNRSFITIARFHDKDNCGFDLKNQTMFANVPPFSNTNLISCISDALMQGAKLALEPFYDKDNFLDSLIMYQPSYVAATKSLWLNISKKILYDENYKNVKLKNLFLTFSAGEPFEINEEILINKALKKVKAGVNFTHTPFSIIKMGEAGGDCEHGSIFYILFRQYQNMKGYYRKNKEASGMKPFELAEVAVLDENGNYCKCGEVGKIVANSPCTMKGYKNNKEANQSFFIKDATGKKWGDMNVYGYLDKYGNINMRGRIPKTGEDIPPFMIAKRILSDRKNILSCEVIQDEKTKMYVAHIELNPKTKKSIREIIIKADKNCKEYADKIDLFYRIRDNKESFPLTGSGKRNVKALKNEGLTDKCIRPLKINGEYYNIEQF